MYADFYKRISQPFRKGNRRRILAVADKALVAITAISFVGIAFYLLLNQDERVVRYVLVCGVSFLVLSAIRALLNKPRPYELYPIDALIAKSTQGKSFPSRHLFSASLISCAFFWLNPCLGLLGFLVTAALAFIRVIGGVHFPKDVIVGIVAGILAGIIGLYLI